MRSVSTGPGLMLTTRTLSSRLRPPSARVNAISAALPVLPAVVEIEPFAGGTDVVDDLTMATRLHGGVDDAGEIDVAEDLELPGMSPGCLVDFFERAAGNVAGVVHQHIDACSHFAQPRDIGRFAQIEGMNSDVHACMRCSRSAIA
jgi:hypothetical protein